jgi:hypothetical protein
MPTCTKCKTEKPRSEFYRRTGTPKGLCPWCKDCNHKAHREYRATARGQELAKLASKRYHRSEYGKEMNRQRARQYAADPKNKKRIRARIRKYQKRNLLKSATKSAVWRAVRAGRLLKPTACSCCREKVIVYAHHEDYSKPLDVIWLCRQCHNDLHVRKRDLATEVA